MPRFGSCCGAFGLPGQPGLPGDSAADDETVFPMGYEADGKADGKAQAQARARAEALRAEAAARAMAELDPREAVGITREALYDKLLAAALASSSPFVNICRMRDMGFRTAEMASHLVRLADEEPAFRFSNTRLLVNMGVLVAFPPLASEPPALEEPVRGEPAPGAAEAAVRCPMRGLFGGGKRAGKGKGKGTAQIPGAWAGRPAPLARPPAGPVSRLSGY